MTTKAYIRKYISGHRIWAVMILCLFGLCVQASLAPKGKKKKKATDERVYLQHADELRYDMYGLNPDAQIVKGKVSFQHLGSTLTCDSAYFYQTSNSVEAFGHVHYRQPDGLTLDCDRADYDGQMQLLHARQNVVLHHHKQILRTDSLDYDRIYELATFFEGGTLIDGKDRLVSDWGQYDTKTREAKFVYNVKLRSGNDVMTTDTLYYDVPTSTAHMVGPSKMISGASVVNTENGYYDTKTDKARLYGRSTVVDKDKTITGDSLYYVKDGMSSGYGNVVYVDKVNKNSLTCNQLQYNEKTGYGFATDRAVAIDYSQKDTLWMHADTMKIYTFNIGTDSVYRKVHAYRKVRAYRLDVQAVCDSLVFNSQDSCMTMYKDPIVWNTGRQLLGEVIHVYMNDSTVRKAEVVGQALSVELMADSTHYNQMASRQMNAYFEDGQIRETESIGNVQTVYYPINDKDSTLMGLNYMETDTMRMYMSPQRQLQKIWTNKSQGTFYPMTQIPPAKYKLPSFAWFDYIRPVSKDDIFQWRGKAAGTELKNIKRHDAPLQTIGKKKPTEASAETTSAPSENSASETLSETSSETKKSKEPAELSKPSDSSEPTAPAAPSAPTAPLKPSKP